jgi:hypothetical protein
MPHARAPPPPAGPSQAVGVGVGVAWRDEARQAAGVRACRAEPAGRVAACMPGRNGKGFTFLMRDPISAEALHLLASKC